MIKKAKEKIEPLVKAAQKGNQEAFGELVKLYQKRVYALVFRYLKSHDKTEEAIQRTFIDAWKYIANFEGRSSFLTWLMRIAINNSKKDLLQSKKEDVNIDDVEIPEFPKVLEELSELERNTLLAEEVRKLTDKQQTILHLRIYENLSFKQIGEVLGCSESTAKSHFHHIKNLLKLALGEPVDSEEGVKVKKENENEDE